MRYQRLVPLLLLCPLFAASAFPGWQPVFVTQPEDASEAVRILQEHGYRRIMSLETARVGFQDFSSMEYLALSEVPDRLHPTDPRYDPFLRAAPRLFEGSAGGQWIYVDSSEWASGAENTLRAAGLNFRLPGNAEPAPQAGFPLGPLVFLAAALGFLLGRERKVLYPALVPSALGALVAVSLLGAPALLPAATVFLFWTHRLRRLREAGERVSRGETPESGAGLEAWVLLLVIPSLWGGQPFDVLKLFLGVLGVFGVGALASAAVVSLWEKQWSQMEHGLFLPARLTPAVRRWHGHLLPVFPLLFLVPGFLTGVTFSNDLPQPWIIERQDDLEGQFFSEQGFESENRRGLPGASLYAAHLAYQEGFAYGMTFGLPRESGLSLPVYRKEGGRFREESELVVDFGGDWIHKTAAGPGAFSLGALLFSPGAPYVLIPGNEAAPVSGFPTLTLLLYFFLLFYQIFHQKLRFSGQGFGLNETYLRRQAA